jgi:hypothetical protein
LLFLLQEVKEINRITKKNLNILLPNL